MILSHPLTINTNLFKQLNINQMFDKIQMILMMKTSISNNRMSRLNKMNRLNHVDVNRENHQSDVKQRSNHHNNPNQNSNTSKKVMVIGESIAKYLRSDELS